jgi:hypothetical protein
MLIFPPPLLIFFFWPMLICGLPLALASGALFFFSLPHLLRTQFFLVSSAGPVPLKLIVLARLKLPSVPAQRPPNSRARLSACTGTSSATYLPVLGSLVGFLSAPLSMAAAQPHLDLQCVPGPLLELARPEFPITASSAAFLSSQPSCPGFRTRRCLVPSAWSSFPCARSWSPRAVKLPASSSDPCTAELFP